MWVPHVQLLHTLLAAESYCQRHAERCSTTAVQCTMLYCQYLMLMIWPSLMKVGPNFSRLLTASAASSRCRASSLPVRKAFAILVNQGAAAAAASVAARQQQQQRQLHSVARLGRCPDRHNTVHSAQQLQLQQQLHTPTQAVARLSRKVKR